MRTVRVTLEIEYDEATWYDLDEQGKPYPESLEWFYDDVLARHHLMLYSNEVGDAVGTVNKVTISETTEKGNDAIIRVHLR